jgi:hypothetical protein
MYRYTLVCLLPCFHSCWNATTMHISCQHSDTSCNDGNIYWVDCHYLLTVVYNVKLLIKMSVNGIYNITICILSFCHSCYNWQNKFPRQVPLGFSRSTRFDLGFVTSTEQKPTLISANSILVLYAGNRFQFVQCVCCQPWYIVVWILRT